MRQRMNSNESNMRRELICKFAHFSLNFIDMEKLSLMPWVLLVLHIRLSKTFNH